MRLALISLLSLAVCTVANLNAAQIGVRDAAFLGSAGGVQITDWAQRVVANGGTLPSPSTIQCMENLRATLVAQGITNKIWSLCVFVPDSIIAASTPLFTHKGYPMWTNNGPFVIGDLNINGLKGNGTNFLDTGIIASSVQTNANNITTNVGITAIVTESATNDGAAILTTQILLPANNTIGLFASGAGISQFYAGQVIVGDFIFTNDYRRIGYISGQHLFSTNAMFVASPIETHKLLAASSGTPSTLQQFNSTLKFFGTQIQNTNVPAGSHNRQRISVGLLHEGFTQTESSNVWWALKTCRECLGGGTGEPIHDYNNVVVAGGGAAISATTSNALRTFRSALGTDDLLYRVAVANAYVPDNLTAARTPVIWQSGNQIWLNIAFGETNLSVNGLQGNGSTKYLNTGINPSTLTYGGFSDTSAGLSEMLYDVPSSANMFEFGTIVTAPGLFSVGNQLGNLVFFCWGFNTLNSDYLSIPAPSPGGTWEGYLSGSRTAANAIRLDWVTNGVHNIATNATGAQNQNNDAMSNAFEHALVNLTTGSSPNNLSDRTVSFLAIHPGLTQTQSSNLWNRVRDLRTSLGGGLP